MLGLHSNELEIEMNTTIKSQSNQCHRSTMIFYSAQLQLSVSFNEQVI